MNFLILQKFLHFFVGVEERGARGYPVHIEVEVHALNGKTVSSVEFYINGTLRHTTTDIVNNIASWDYWETPEEEAQYGHETHVISIEAKVIGNFQIFLRILK